MRVEQKVQERGLTFLSACNDQLKLLLLAKELAQVKDRDIQVISVGSGQEFQPPDSKLQGVQKI